MQRKTRKTTNKTRWDTIANKVWSNRIIFHKPQWKYTRPNRFVLSQRGGGEITIDSQIFEYNEDRNSSGNLFITGKVNDSHECFHIKFETHTNGQLFAYLSSLDGNKKCSTDGSAKSANILRAAVELAREKGAHWIDLIDNSKICKDTNVPSVSLANYYFLSRAKTWYETILPFKPDDPELIDDSREQVRNTSWDDMAIIMKKRFPSRYKSMMRNMPISLSSIPTSAPGSVMHVIRSIPYNVRCSFLYHYMDSIFVSLMISPLDGTGWWLPLTPDANRPPPYVTGNDIGVERNGFIDN